MKPVILDCDPGHDDMVAIILAAGSPEIDLLAITTVAGNGTLERTTANARATCALAGIRGVPIAAGAPGPLLGGLRTAPTVHGESALDGAELPSGDDIPLAAEHAVELIARLLREHPEPVTLVPVGPLTNVALLLRTHPDVVGRIEQIVADGRLDERGQRHPVRRVQHLGRPRGRRGRVHQRRAGHALRARRHAPGARHRRGARSDARRRHAARRHAGRPARLLPRPLPGHLGDRRAAGA